VQPLTVTKENTKHNKGLNNFNKNHNFPPWIKLFDPFQHRGVAIVFWGPTMMMVMMMIIIIIIIIFQTIIIQILISAKIKVYIHGLRAVWMTYIHRLERNLTHSQLMSYIDGDPSKARNLTSYMYVRDFLLRILLLEPCISLIYA
jgi:hypothetical protein